MTEAPRVTLEALPPELLVQMLSYLPTRALVTRCRPVCPAWRDVTDDRALYALAQRCPTTGDRHDELPFCALARSCLRAPLGRNLIFNSRRAWVPGGGAFRLVGGA